MVEREDDDRQQQERDQMFLLERSLRDERAAVPRNLIQEYQKLLVKKVSEDAPAGGGADKVFQIKDNSGKTIWVKFSDKGVMEEVAEPKDKSSKTASKEKVTALKEALNDDELEDLNSLEERLLEGILEKGLRKSREKVGGLRHANLVPYDERELEFTLTEVKNFRDSLNTLLEQSGESATSNPRAREIMARVNGLVDWVQGNVDLLLVSGATLDSFFDGWATLATAVKKQRRDMTSDELDKKYAGSLKNAREGTTGHEVLRKQDQMYEIYRGIAGIHHSQGRNRGEKLQGDYEVGYRKVEKAGGVVTEASKETERKRTKFINEVFSHAKEDTFEVNDGFINEWMNNTVDDNAVFHKGVVWKVNGVEVLRFDKKFLNGLRGKRGVLVTRETQFVESVGEVWRSRDAKSELQKIFSEPENKDSKQKVLVGKRRAVDRTLIKELKRGLFWGSGPKTIWVNGAEWKVDENTVEELSWSVGSGDSIFIGTVKEVTSTSFKGTNFGSKETALLSNTAASVDNVFTMDQPPNQTDPVRKKLSLMLEQDVWEKLSRPGANVDELIRDFKARLEEHQVSAIHEHFIDTERLALLFYAEGAELGWGFDYKLDKAISRKQKERKGPDTKVIKREVVEGSTDACTDMSTALNWLRTDAKNTQKWWPSSILPMDQVIQRQIVEHEPGWAPWLGKEKIEGKLVDGKAEGWWKTRIHELPFKTDVPTRFKMAMLDAVSMSETTEEMVRLTGKNKKVRPMDLIKKGKKMSEIEWRNMDKTIQYRWFITLSQLALAEGLFSKKPDKRLIEQFFGNVENVPPQAYLEELNKRLSLGLRDLPSGDELKKFIPYAVSMYQAWRKGMLPDSAETDYYQDVEEKGSKEIARTLGGMNPGGDTEFGGFVSKRFKFYMKQLRPIGRRHLVKQVEERGIFG